MSFDAREMCSSENWWSALSDECPITLEPLSELPYPPFILYSKDERHDKSAPPKTGSQYFFDGLALATYIISQGNFANPLTRRQLSYNDCVRLDNYLDEHVHKTEGGKQHIQSTVLGGERISVREAYALRNSIKVKVSTGNVGNEAEVRREEMLRNEAALALRGLFVFGHHGGGHDNRSSTTHEPNSQQQIPSLAGGFDLNYTSDTNQHHTWGMGPVVEQEGLRIVDDNEAAFQSADAAAWQEIQDAFPHLEGASIQQPERVYGTSEILDVARRAARLTLQEEGEEAQRRERNQRLYFMQALERKKRRIIAKQQAKEAAVASFIDGQKAKDELQTARNEIDRWRDQQWQRWEKDNMKHNDKQKQSDSDNRNVHVKATSCDELDVACVAETDKRAADEEEARAKAAAKKKAKRQRAKERAKEKKKEEQSAKQEQERIIELQKKKDSSGVKCGACGEGVLGYGFEKFGTKFCSTKCARSGPKSS